MRVEPAPRVGAIATAAAVSVALAAGLGGGLIAASAPRAHADPCALPAGLELTALDDADRSWIAHRTLACMDVAAGRIDAAAYRATIAELDHPTPTPVATPAAPPPPATAKMVWATRVLGFSSQWSDDAWSAARVLGAPDVEALGTDAPQAWASRGADDRDEWIEVALAQPTRLAGLRVIESYNPGAITRVEVADADGARRIVYWGAAAPLGPAGHELAVALGCAQAPVASIRVTLDSRAVIGWNELDAIGGVACE
ncbi:MAG: hypothetical protein IPL61_26970 [Myxococcales bacterium]|nr:hypothetical protein [Myxococcales bacterium]